MLAFLVALSLLPHSPRYASTPAADATSPPGLLVMAHGGDPEWDAAVRAAVAPLRRQYPVAIAFGMADPRTLDAALDSLASQGVERVAVVRLFLDGQSFLHQTEYLLGIRPDPPAQVPGHRHAGDGHGQDSTPGHSDRRTSGPLRHRSRIAISHEGLMTAQAAGAILTERVMTLSETPAAESVLVLAHGTEHDAENARWLEAMEHHGEAIRRLGFHTVRAETLREDWPEPRAAAERRIRSFVEAETNAGRTVLVIPFRLFGFGSYHEVLSGLSYRATETALLPHPSITSWIDGQYQAALRREGWATPTP